jgi:hypothetical protein
MSWLEVGLCSLAARPGSPLHIPEGLIPYPSVCSMFPYTCPPCAIGCFTLIPCMQAAVLIYSQWLSQACDPEESGHI